MGIARERVTDRNQTHETGELTHGIKYMIDFGRGGNNTDLAYCIDRIEVIIKERGGKLPSGFVVTSKNGAAMVRTPNAGPVKNVTF